MKAQFVKEFVTNNSINYMKSLYDMADFINGAAFKKDEYAQEGLPIIKIAELKNGVTDSTQYFNGKKDDKYFIYDREILFSWSGNPDTSIDTFIWTGGEAILNQHTFRVLPKDNEEVYIYLLLKYHKPIFAEIARNKQTTGLGHVTVADLKRLTFAYDESKIKEFCIRMQPVYDRFILSMFENKKLSSIRDTLLPRLMLGQVELGDVTLEI